jgi:outer membrane protein OmpA-like peptidoglycan-associated protein
MKYFFTLLTCLLLAAASQAQLRLGVLGGPHSAKVIEKNDIPFWDTTTKPYYLNRKGFNIGFIAEIPLGPSNKLFFQPAILYHSKGRRYVRFFDTTVVDTDTLNLNTSFYTNYIDLPLNLTYKLRLGRKSSFMLSAGPYISFYYNGKNTVESRVAINDTTVSFKKNQNSIEVGNGENKVKTLDFGINARAGFELGSVLLTGFISQGLSNFYQAGYDGTFKHQVIGASVGFWLNPPTKLKPRDKDGDGIPDKEDGCPDQPGTAATGGCPDRDGDGIADGVDKCADVAGLARYNGCPIPDRDQDGVNDEEDKCPDQAGVARYGGCPIPDTDGDGINDEADSCVDKPGTAEYHGCPIPDTDGDGLNDKEDQCPTEAGTKENNGCPAVQEEIVEKVNYAAKNIFFSLGSDKLTNASFPALDEVADILLQHTDLHLVIDGYTDNTGNPAYNLVLSQKRVDAVKKYLVQKGIDAARIKATGHGQDNPVADNSTREGRAQNRRVEMKVEQ